MVKATGLGVGLPKLFLSSNPHKTSPQKCGNHLHYQYMTIEVNAFTCSQNLIFNPKNCHFFLFHS